MGQYRMHKCYPLEVIMTPLMIDTRLAQHDLGFAPKLNEDEMIVCPAREVMGIEFEFVGPFFEGALMTLTHGLENYGKHPWAKYSTFGVNINNKIEINPCYVKNIRRLDENMAVVNFVARRISRLDI